MTYKELKAKGLQEWIIEGPNSGGMVGYIIYEGNVYQFGGDWGMAEPHVSEPQSITSFLSWAKNSDNPRIKAIIEHLESGK